MLAAIVAAAIEVRIDRALYEVVLDEEQKARRDVLSRLRDA